MSEALICEGKKWNMNAGRNVRINVMLYNVMLYNVMLESNLDPLVLGPLYYRHKNNG